MPDPTSARVATRANGGASEGPPVGARAVGVAYWAYCAVAAAVGVAVAVAVGLAVAVAVAVGLAVIPPPRCCSAKAAEQQHKHRAHAQQDQYPLHMGLSSYLHIECRNKGTHLSLLLGHCERLTRPGQRPLRTLNHVFIPLNLGT
jgi:hypothetical protein